MKTKRVCELVVGDHFIWMGTAFFVIRIDEEKIHYASKYIYETASTSHYYSFGRKNQMKVEIIPVSNGGNPKTDIAHQPELESSF